MKNLIKFFMVMAVLCMTACSQTFENVSNDVKSQEKAKGRLVMSVVSQSRTIMPNFSESVTLTANGTEIGSWSGDNVITQIENDNSILLDVGSYNFEMVFYNENGDVIFIGAINNQEIKAGDNSLTFDMKMVIDIGNISIELSWEADSGICKIKAGLYDIATGEAVAGYEAEELTISGTQSTYLKDNVPAGQYIIKFEVYDTSDKLLNTLTDVIKVLGGMTTSDQKVLSKINTQYTITYNLAGGSWKSGFTPVTVRNANTGIILPTSKNIKKTNYILAGWYDENGDRIRQIPSDTIGDITLTARWWYPNGFVYVEGATRTGAVTASGIFKAGETVTVPSLYVCNHEVTQAEYEKYCSYGGYSPSSSYGDGDNYPAYYVSWFDALVYCNKRSIDKGLTPCYTINGSTNPTDWGSIPDSDSHENWDSWWAVTCDFEANGYRLPTRAEWEYSARGGKGLYGTQYTYAGSDTIGDVAWYKDNSDSKTHPVKGKEANGLGLYDMSGNVWEWCWDSYDSGDRYMRGGSWNLSADRCTVSSGGISNAYDRDRYSGFRVVRTEKVITTVGCIAYSDGSVSRNYDSTKTPIGIVIEDTDGVATKIVSLTETYEQWSTEEVNTNAMSTTDGVANMTAIQSIDGWEEKYPAFKWCDDYTDESGNSEWYLPATDELRQLHQVKDYVDKAINKIRAGGGTARNLSKDWYWVSNQDSYNLGSPIWFGGDGRTDGSHRYKKRSHYVRAVRAF